MTTKTTKTVKAAAPVHKRNVRPDTPDFRDHPFRPNIAVAPLPELFPDFLLDVKNQQDTSACTGFSLSLVVEYLLRKAQRETAADVSPYMLYSLARRYDEFPGSRDEGSSLRGALKGWHKHGVRFPAVRFCREELTQKIKTDFNLLRNELTRLRGLTSRGHDHRVPSEILRHPPFRN